MRNNYTNFFTDLANTLPYAHIALQGEAGDGKTYTAALMLAGIYRMIKSDKPLVIFDTEDSSKFLRKMFAKHNIPVIVKKSRTLSDLIDTMDFCESGGSNVLLIDSITHVWENFVEAYKTANNRKFIQFADWGLIKPQWKREFSRRAVEGAFHYAFTGRQGDTYETIETNGKKELIKSGVKMKAEGETAYEPDLLVQMNAVQEIGPKGKITVYHDATILKDRSNLIQGQTFREPNFKAFKPFIDFLFTDIAAPTQTISGDDRDLVERNREFNEDRKQRDIWLERINALMDKHCGGQKKEDKARKVEVMEYAFHGETSELAIANMNVGQLESALERMKEILEPKLEEATNG